MLEEQQTTNVLGHYLLMSNLDTLKQYIDHVKQRLGPDLNNFLVANYVWSPLNNAETFVANTTRAELIEYDKYLLNLDIVKHTYFYCHGSMTDFLEVAKMVRKKIEDEATLQRSVQKNLGYFQQRLVEAVLMYEITQGTVA